MRPWFLLNVLIVFTAISLCYLLVNHLYVAAFTNFLLVSVLVAIHITKFKILGLPLFFWDYIVLREPLLYIPAFIQKKSTYLIFFLVLGTMIGSFALVARLPAHPASVQPRVITPVLSLCLLMICFYFFRAPYHKFFPANSFRDSIVFKTGLLPFVILTARYSKASPTPADYTRIALTTIVEKFCGTNSHSENQATESLPNVILYGIESLMDMASLGVKLKNDPMPFFSSLAEQTGRSLFVSPTFGGQTVQPEFEVLTGLSQYHLSVPNPFVHIIGNYERFPALSGVFKKQGYYCLGVQAVSSLEFQRRNYYPLIEFDRFVALESDYPKQDWQMIHHLLADEYLVKKVKELLPPDDKPVFGLFLTNSTHVSYDSWERNRQFAVLNENCSEKTKDTLERYASAVAQADQALQMMVEHFKRQRRKTILFVFGDHLPGLNSVFQELGVFTGNKGFHRFHTPLRIWSNSTIPKQDRIVSANLLPGLICNLLKIDQSLLPIQLRLVLELYKKVDVLSSYIRDKQGNVYSRQQPPAFLRELIRAYDLVQFDLLEGSKYALSAKGKST
jgi:phosphoglycerol transferase MdoB-like AlkP superfamily enzyme